nr:alpha/beta hydrolase fold domain-containing protein [Rhodococcus wratislaviensis]
MFRTFRSTGSRHCIPDALGVDGYRWLLGQGFDAEKIVIAGDSAGGYLTFMTALTLADLHLPCPAAWSRCHR